MSYFNPSYMNRPSRSSGRAAARAEDARLYKLANPELVAYLERKIVEVERRGGGFDFPEKMMAAINQWGGLTENQKAAVERMMARDAEYAANRAARQAEAPVEEVHPFVPRMIAESVSEDQSHAPSDPHLMTNADRAWNYMMAGRAKVTAVSKRTGTRFTFRIRASKDGKVRFVHLLNGSDNENSYAYLGFIKNEAYVHGGAKAKVGVDAPGAKAFSWVFENLKASKMPEALEVWHEGTCGRCGRALTVPESIERGIGPECASKMGD